MVPRSSVLSSERMRETFGELDPVRQKTGSKKNGRKKSRLGFRGESVKRRAVLEPRSLEASAPRALQINQMLFRSPAGCGCASPRFGDMGDGHKSGARR